MQILEMYKRQWKKQAPSSRGIRLFKRTRIFYNSEKLMVEFLKTGCEDREILESNMIGQTDRVWQTSNTASKIL